jgi:histidine ammonia-lyase
MMSSLVSQAFVGALTLLRSAEILLALSLEVFGVSKLQFHPTFVKRQKSEHLRNLSVRVSQLLDA